MLRFVERAAMTRFHVDIKSGLSPPSFPLVLNAFSGVVKCLWCGARALTQRCLDAAILLLRRADSALQMPPDASMLRELLCVAMLVAVRMGMGRSRTHGCVVMPREPRMVISCTCAHA